MNAPFPDEQAERDFQQWWAEQQRAEFLDSCPECPRCGEPMPSELKNGEFIDRRTEGYWMRRCWPCGKIWQSVRGEWKVWTPAT